MRFHDLPGNVEPEAEAPVLATRHRPLEPREDALEVGLGNPDAIVLDGERRAFASARDHYLDRSARSVLDGIGEQVFEDLLEASAIPVTPERPRDPDTTADFAAGVASSVARPLYRIARDPHQITLFRLKLQAARGDARHVEKTVDERRQATGGLDRLVDFAGELTVQAVHLGLVEHVLQPLQLKHQ
jgi:hypothetical protein